MMLKNCAVLKLHAVNPRFLNVGEMKIGEKDHFHVIGRERGEWFFYRRIDQKLTEKELKSLRDYNWKIDVTYDVTPSTNIIRAEIPKFQGKFYNEINNITGVRVSPVTFQSGGDVYISVEFTENKIAKISDKILDFVNKDYSYKRSIIYMGPQQGGKPYLLNLYLSMGNSPHDLTFVKTRWSFNGNEATMENEGIFQNMGEFVPKQFADDKTDELIWKMRSEEMMGRAQVDIIDKKNLIVEMKVRSRFFSDFYQSLTYSPR